MQRCREHAIAVVIGISPVSEIARGLNLLIKSLKILCVLDLISILEKNPLFNQLMNSIFCVISVSNISHLIQCSKSILSLIVLHFGRLAENQHGFVE